MKGSTGGFEKQGVCSVLFRYLLCGTNLDKTSIKFSCDVSLYHSDLLPSVLLLSFFTFFFLAPNQFKFKLHLMLRMDHSMCIKGFLLFWRGGSALPGGSLSYSRLLPS